MIDTINKDKDLYAMVASKAFHLPYEECLEHFPKDTPIKKIDDKWYYSTLSDYDKLADGITDTYSDGKKRRSKAKVILLGLLYGRGVKALAQQLGSSKIEAQSIIDSVFSAFPKIKEFENQSKQFCRDNEYVTTLWGRKRRLPEINLPEYEFDYSKRPLMGEVDKQQFERKYKGLLNSKWGDAKKKLIEDIKKAENVIIKDNTGTIAEAEREVVNSMIQLSAADMTKLAMIELSKSEELKKLKCNMLIPIHDEILFECPVYNAETAMKYISDIMSHIAEEKTGMIIKVDPTCSFEWSGEEVDLKAI